MANDPILHEILAEAFALDDAAQRDFEALEARRLEREVIQRSADYDIVYKRMENARVMPQPEYATREYVEHVAGEAASVIGAETGVMKREMRDEIAALRKEIAALRQELQTGTHKLQGEVGDVVRLQARR